MVDVEKLEYKDLNEDLEELMADKSEEKVSLLVGGNICLGYEVRDDHYVMINSF